MTYSIMPASAYLNDGSICPLGTFFTTVSQTITSGPWKFTNSKEVYSLFILHDKLKIVTWISTN